MGAIALSERQMNERYDGEVYRFMVFPLIVIIGIYVVSSVADLILGLNNETFRMVFTGVGGIPFLFCYYNRELARALEHKSG